MTLLRDISTMYASLFSLVMLMILFESRFSRKKTAVLTLSLMLPLLLINFALLLFLGPETMSTLMLVTCSLPSLLFFWFLAKHRDGRFFFTFCLADTLILELIHSTVVLDYFLGNTYLVLATARFLLCPLVAFAVYKWFRPIYLDIQNTVQKGWYTFTAIALLFYVVLSMSISTPCIITQRPEQLPAFVLLLILMPAIYVQIFFTLRHMQKMHEITEQDNILRLQVSNMTARMEEFSAADEKFRVERHNIRHKMQTIVSLVEKEEYGALRRLVTEYTESAQEIQVKRYCKNAVIDAVLSAYLQKAESRSIRVSTALSFPEKLPVNEAELATVFSNAIENAIHACEKLEADRRQIEVKVLTAPCFMLQISNSYNGEIEFDKKGIPVSHEDGHGFGTRSIVAFCEKYGCFYEFKALDEKFQLRISF